MSPDGRQILGEGEIVFDGTLNHPTAEGPKMHKLGGYYYISLPAGGVVCGWQLILRSKNILGPYEEKVVLSQQGTKINGPHQGALVDDVQGNWWFVHFQDRQPYGRICHLQPVHWEDDWPLIGINQDQNGIGEPVTTWNIPASISGPADESLPAGSTVIPAATDEFNSAVLGLQWQWHSNHQDDWYSLKAAPGKLRLFAQALPEEGITFLGSVIGQKVPAPSIACQYG